MALEVKRFVDNAISAFESEAWTSIPAVVTRISSAGDQTIISVKPTLSRLFRGSEPKEYPPIHDVPVMWPSTSTSTVRGVLSKGDWVLLVFSCRPISNWLNSPEGGITDPESFQKMDYNSAIAIPGLFPFSKNVNTPSNQSLPDDQADMIVKSNIGTATENEVRLKADGGVTITASSSGTVVTIAADGTMVIDAAAGMTVNAGTAGMILNGPLQVNGLINSSSTVTGTVVTGSTGVTSGAIPFGTHIHTHTDKADGSGNLTLQPTSIALTPP